MDHVLRRFFRAAARNAFAGFRALHDPAIEDHICDGILADFVHVDRIHKLRDQSGQALTELSDMALEELRSTPAQGFERDLEVHQHVGDYALFMAGLFPEFVSRRGLPGASPLLAYVGAAVVSLREPVDYYIVEGRSAYSHVSRLYRGLDSGKAHVFHRLSSRFEEYLGVMRGIRDYLRSAPRDPDASAAGFIG